MNLTFSKDLPSFSAIVFSLSSLRGDFMKKIQKKSNLQGCPRCARGLLGLFLCFVLLFSFPFSVFAESINTVYVYSFKGFDSNNNAVNISVNSDKSVPFTLSSSNYKSVNYTSVYLKFDFNQKVSKGDILSVYGSITAGSRYTDFTSFNGQYGDASNFEFDNSSGEFSFDFTFDSTYNLNDIYFYFFFWHNGSTYNNVYLRIESLNYDFNDNKTGLLNTILDWLRSIKDGLTNFKDNVQLWINGIKENINQRFTNLSSWLTTVKEAIVSKELLY